MRFTNLLSWVKICYEVHYIALDPSACDLTLNIYPPQPSLAQQLTRLSHTKKYYIVSSHSSLHISISLFDISISVSNSQPLIILTYLYLYVYGLLAITIYCKKPNPNVVRSSMYVCVLLFLPAVAFLVRAFFPRITFLSTLSYRPPTLTCGSSRAT
jgi:hypothetical protein